jgi:hypothetical protein
MRAGLPSALAGLPELTAALPGESSSFCSLHGPQLGTNCPACDEHFPEQVAARAIGASPLSMGILPADVQKMIDAAVQTAVKEALAFEAWKSSPEGRAAAAVAQTAHAVAPAHGAQPGDEPSGPVNPAPVG